jgi:hypothetical protein
MWWRVTSLSVVLASSFFVSFPACGQSSVDELGPLAVALSLARFEHLALLSPGSYLRNSQLSQEARWRRAAAQSTVPILLRQAIWPVYAETEDGVRYWGEITRSDDDSFDLLNRKTNQKVTLAYASVRGIGIAKGSPRSKPPSATEKTLQRTGDIIGTILLIPMRILELFLIPQC